MPPGRSALFEQPQSGLLLQLVRLDPTPSNPGSKPEYGQEVLS